MIIILISVHHCQFVHDQTVRLMNKGLTAREIAARVKLPPHLATHPYLIEYYGTVEWSGTGCLTSARFTGTPCTVRAVYHGYLGWFSGRAAELHPLPQQEEARRLVRLAGGRWVLTWDLFRSYPPCIQVQCSVGCPGCGGRG